MFLLIKSARQGLAKLYLIIIFWSLF